MSEIKLIVALKGKLHALSVRIARLQSRAGDDLDIEVEQIVKLCRETSDMLPSDAAMRVMGSVTSEPRMDSSHRKLSERIAELEAQKAQPPCGADGAVLADRDYLGRAVREAWVRWALTQPNPKQSWLAPYDDLSEPDKEADRQIGEHIAALLASQPAAPVAPATVAGADGWGIYRAYGSKGELLLVHNEQKAVATSIDENNPAYGILNAMLAASQREGGGT